MKFHFTGLLMALRIINISCTDSAIDILTNIQRTIRGIFCPPPYKSLIVGSLVAYLPIKLRDAIIDPSLVHP